MMPRLTVFFTKMVQNSQEAGTTDEHAVSRVHFVIDVDGKQSGPFHADVKLVVGGKYESDPLEVAAPVGYPRGAPFNQAKFADAVTAYIRKCVGSSAQGIRIGPGSSVKMLNNTFAFKDQASFDVEKVTGTW
jgi:hypothetical protein